MSLSVIVSDASIPIARAVYSSLRSSGHNASILVTPEGGGAGLEVDASSLRWKRQSNLSARAVVLDAATRHSPPDVAVIFFDESLVSSLSLPSEGISSLIDAFVSGYAHLAREVVQSFMKSGKGRLVLVRSGNRLPHVSEPGSAALAASLAAGAFRALAEETKAYLRDAARGRVDAVLLDVRAQCGRAMDDDVVAAILPFIADRKGRLSRARCLREWGSASIPRVPRLVF